MGTINDIMYGIGADENTQYNHPSAKRYAVYAYQAIRCNGVRIPVHLDAPIEIDDLSELRDRIRKSYKAQAVRLVYTENMFSECAEESP
jgi:hypothetical protein